MPRTFPCASCDADKPLTGARSIDGALWCADCGEVADKIDAEMAESEPTRTISAAMMNVLLERMQLEVVS